VPTLLSHLGFRASYAHSVLVVSNMCRPRFRVILKGALDRGFEPHQPPRDRGQYLHSVTMSKL